MKQKPKSRAKHRASEAVQRVEKLASTLPRDQWQHRLKSLYERLKESQGAERGIEHDDVQELLPAYIRAEQRGPNAHKVYPAVWQHLQTCVQCQEVYEFLLTALGQSKRPPIGVPAVKQNPAVSPSPETVKVTSKTKGSDPTGYTIQFYPGFIRSLIQKSSGSFATVQGRDQRKSIWSEMEERLLWSGELTLQGQMVSIEAWLVPAPELEGRNHIRIMLDAQRPLKQSLRVRLVWGGKAHSSEFAAEELHFEDISPPDFQNYSDDELSDDFSLSFEQISHVRRRKH